MPPKRDTTPEFAALEERWWMGLTGVERIEWWQRRQRLFAVNRYNQIRARHPEATHGELMALWLEDQYGDSLNPRFLAGAKEYMRTYYDGEADNSAGSGTATP